MAKAGKDLVGTRKNDKGKRVSLWGIREFRPFLTWAMQTNQRNVNLNVHQIILSEVQIHGSICCFGGCIV